MDRKDYQYIHNSLGKNNQINTASCANNYIHNLLPKINSQNIIRGSYGSGLIKENGILQINKQDLSSMVIKNADIHQISKNKESGAIIFCRYATMIKDGTLIFCA